MRKNILKVILATFNVSVAFLSSSKAVITSTGIQCQPGDGICSITTDAGGNRHIHPGILIYTQKN